jgi:hypothetical protein
MKIKFNNSWMSLCVQDNKKLHLVERIICGAPVEDFSELMKVGELPLDVDCWARKASPFTGNKLLPDLSTEDAPFLNMYIKSGNEFFQVGAVCVLQTDVRKFVENREGDDCGLIATDQMGFCYLVSHKSVKPKMAA